MCRGGPRRSWSAEAAIAELRRLYRAGKVRMTANALVAAGHTGLASAIHKYIGSFERARRRARIPSPGRLSPVAIEEWDEDRVVGEIRERHRTGQSVAYKQVPTKLVDAALYYCGSWKDAIEMAGLDYREIRQSEAPWTHEAILREGAKTGAARAEMDRSSRPCGSRRAGRSDLWMRRSRRRDPSRADAASFAPR